MKQDVIQIKYYNKVNYFYNMKENLIITRHAQSCNNALCGELTACRDLDPSLTKEGIEDALKIANERKGKSSIRYDSDTVCVTMMNRTWATAVLLYGSFKLRKGKTKKALKLYVSPFACGSDHRYIPMEQAVSGFKLFLDKCVRPPLMNVKNNYKIKLNIPVGLSSKNNIEWETIVIQYDCNEPTCTEVVSDKKGAYIVENTYLDGKFAPSECCWRFVSKSQPVTTDDGEKGVMLDYGGLTTKEDLRDKIKKSNRFLRSKPGKAVYFSDQSIDQFVHDFAFTKDCVPRAKYCDKSCKTKRIHLVSHSKPMREYMNNHNAKEYNKFCKNGWKNNNLWSLECNVKSRKETELSLGKHVGSFNNVKYSCIKRNKKKCLKSVLCGNKYTLMKQRLKRFLIRMK